MSVSRHNSVGARRSLLCVCVMEFVTLHDLAPAGKRGPVWRDQHSNDSRIFVVATTKVDFFVYNQANSAGMWYKPPGQWSLIAVYRPAVFRMTMIPDIAKSGPL